MLLIFSYVPFILMQGIIAALLASWLLPESVANEAKPYPWRRVILGFGLCTGLLNGLLFWLLLLAQGEGVSLGHLLDNIARFLRRDFCLVPGLPGGVFNARPGILFIFWP